MINDEPSLVDQTERNGEKRYGGKSKRSAQLYTEYRNTQDPPGL